MFEMPRWPGGCWFGSSHSSLPGWPASVVSSEKLSPPSVLSKIPGASAPTSSFPSVAASEATFDTFRSPASSYVRPSLECAQVSPRSLLRHTADPCHSLAAAA